MGQGDFHLDGMKRIIEVQKSVGALTGDIDLSKVVDTQFLPDDLKTGDNRTRDRRIIAWSRHRLHCAG